LLGQENFKFIFLNEIKDMKNTQAHIEEIETLLNNFNKGFEDIFEKMKNENLKNLKSDIKLYQAEWMKNFNQEFKNPKASNSNFDLLSFENCDLLKTNVNDLARPTRITKIKGKT
jgi:hypothetical protein